MASRASRAGPQPGRRPPLPRELLLALLTLGAYAAVHLATHGRHAAAQANGWALLDLERRLHIDMEHGLNVWLAGHSGLAVLANYEYAMTYVISAFVLLIWLYIKRPDTYRWARSSFILLNVMAFVVFALYPTAPPRLLADAPFVDTVTRDSTWGSWGSPLVGNANQLAAMPSLHVAWAVWVSVVLARISGARWLQGASALHVLLTTYVIMATANHYLVDAVAGAGLVWVALAVMSLVVDRPGPGVAPRVAAADAFFLYAESPAWPQQVGGVVVMDDDGRCYDRRLRAVIEQRLDQLPKFSLKLSTSSRWRHPRWVAAEAPDLDWHVPHRDLSRPDGSPGGWAALHAYVAELQATPLPRDRPLWRFAAVTGFAPGKAAAVLIVHHVIADGMGTVAQAVRLLDPTPPPATAPPIRAGVLRRAAGITLGLAQLATDGGSRHRLPSGDTPARRFGLATVRLDDVRHIAYRAGLRVTDVITTAIAGAVRRTLGDQAPPTLRVSETLMVRAPDPATGGNVTAAVMTSVPLDDRPEADRLAEVGRIGRRTRRDSRALASRWVMGSLARVLPPPVHAWFARTVYGIRFFQAIVSNMPGPTGSYELAGGAIREVYPVLPLARRAPVAVGVIGWDGTLCLGITVEPSLVDRVDRPWPDRRGRKGGGASPAGTTASPNGAGPAGDCGSELAGDAEPFVDAVRLVLAELSAAADVPAESETAAAGAPAALDLD